jgi:hypothetical protein
MVVGSVQRMSMRHFGVMRGFFVISRLGVFRGLAMMLCCPLVVLRGLLMMFMDVVFVNIVTVHCSLPDSRHCRMLETSSGSMN